MGKKLIDLNKDLIFAGVLELLDSHGSKPCGPKAREGWSPSSGTLKFSENF